ncbi:MAG: hypothetical protein ACI9TV_000339 [Sulfurimonas sp.]|jgi:hypothetical protein|uniref:hypothetical protein n=1 Tax=Sulfurimonas sp. TaxID=2022749 RepID=UPI0039E68CEB
MESIKYPNVIDFLSYLETVIVPNLNLDDYVTREYSYKSYILDNKGMIINNIDYYSKDIYTTLDILDNHKPRLDELSAYKVLIMVIKALIDIKQSCLLVNRNENENNFITNYENLKKKYEEVSRFIYLKRVYKSDDDILNSSLEPNCEIEFMLPRTPTEIRYQLQINIELELELTRKVNFDFETGKKTKLHTTTKKIMNQIFNKQKFNIPKSEQDKLNKLYPHIYSLNKKKKYNK